MTRLTKTTKQVLDQMTEYKYCPKEVICALSMYLDGVEDQLESDNFLPEQDVTWEATIDLFLDIVRVAHFDHTPV